MKETLGFSWWPLQSPPRPPLAMAAGRGRRGEKPVIGHFFGGYLMEKPVDRPFLKVYIPSRERIHIPPIGKFGKASNLQKCPFDGIW